MEAEAKLAATERAIAAAVSLAGAPNVLLVMLDDVGFGASSAFGGPVQMPARRLTRQLCLTTHY